MERRQSTTGFELVSKAKLATRHAPSPQPAQPDSVHRVLPSSWFGILCLATLAALVLCATAAAQGPCARVPGKWRCRACGYLNQANATYCLRDRANLDEQRRRFRNELTPLLKLSPKRIERGDSAVLNWFTSCTSRVVIEPDVGEVASYGSIRVRPAVSSTYRIRVESEWIDWMLPPPPVTVEVLPPLPEVDLRLWPTHIWAGDSVFLAWKSKNASSLTIEPGALHVSAAGQTDISGLQQTTGFKLEAMGEGTPLVVKQASVQVRQMPEPPPMANPPPYRALFEQAAPSVFFTTGEPSPRRQAGAFLSPATVSALDRFSAFLNQYSAIHLRIVGMAWEGGTSDRQRDSRLQQSLMVRRRDAVADYLLQRRVALERMTRVGSGTLREISLGSQLKGRAPTEPVPGVVFEFTGTHPELRAEVIPTQISAGETAYIVWNTRNAEQVWIDPRIGQAQLRGRVRVAPDANANYLLSARNSYGLVDSVSLSLAVLPAPDHEPVLSADREPWPPADLSDIFFAPRSSSLSPVASKLLGRAAAWLVQARNRLLRVTLTGYTDGTEGPTLGRQRAEACRRSLIEEGVASTRLIVVPPKGPSFDEFDRVTNAGAWRSMNRRVQLSVQRRSQP